MLDQDRKQRLQRVRQLEQLVQTAVNTVDPIGLFRLGAPDDEYELEVELILGALIQLGPNQSELAVAIRQVFDQTFGSGARPAGWSELIAQLICEGWPAVFAAD